MEKSFSENVTNILDAAALAIVKNESRNKVYGVEGLEPGDRFTIVANENGKVATGHEFNGNNYLRLNCVGDRSNISFTSLLGTAKVKKYFASAKYKPTFAEGYDSAKAIADAWAPKSRNEAEFLESVPDLVGTQFECIASVVDDQTFADASGNPQERTLYLFRVIK